MKLLALETSTEFCSAAVMVDNQIYDICERAPRRHNEIILSMCNDLLIEANIRSSQLDVIAFGRGPGAFTGVRLAASIAQGIALAHDLPVVPVSSLAALAQGAHHTYKASNIYPCLDARMKEIYCAFYQLNENGIMQLKGGEKVISPGKIQFDISKKCIGVGSGWKTYSKELLEQIKSQIVYYEDEFPQARYVAELGKYYFNKGEYVSALEALPVYLRNNVAVKHKNNSK